MPKRKQESWEEIFNSESEKAFWEIVHDRKAQTVRLIFVPDEEYNKKMVETTVSYEQFDDLCNFINRISKPKNEPSAK